MVECAFRKYVIVGSSPVADTQISDITSVSSKEFLDQQITIECRLTLKCVRDSYKQTAIILSDMKISVS